jgi:hypothetical protein
MSRAEFDAMTSSRVRFSFGDFLKKIMCAGEVHTIQDISEKMATADENNRVLAERYIAGMVENMKGDFCESAMSRALRGYFTRYNVGKKTEEKIQYKMQGDTLYFFWEAAQ